MLMFINDFERVSYNTTCVRQHIFYLYSEENSWKRRLIAKLMLSFTKSVSLNQMTMSRFWPQARK